MAGRNSIGVGVGVTIFISLALTVGLLVAFAIYFTKYKDTSQALTTLQQSVNSFVSPAEQGTDSTRRLIGEAQKARLSVFAYLQNAQGETMSRITGSKLDDLKTMEEKLAPLAGQGKTLMSVLAEKNAEIGSLKQQAAQAEEARNTALSSLSAEVNRVKKIEEAHQATVAALNAEVKQYKDEVERYRSGIDVHRGQLDQRLDQARTEFATVESKLKEQIDALTKENLILKNQAQAFRDAGKAVTLRPGDEYALVDGNIVGVDGANRRCSISLGAKNKVRVGMTFTVYGSAAAIRPDAEGNYPSGKATIEITRVDAESSECRILSEARGNPIVQGDVIANALYDPNKVYRFVVYGNFDVNRDGVATALERTDLAALIEEWGGVVTDELTGNVDFLVLGEPSALPPPPSQDAPQEVFQEYIRQRKAIERYDQLFAEARSTSIPVLNENRLYTLIGKTPASTRR